VIQAAQLMSLACRLLGDFGSHRHRFKYGTPVFSLVIHGMAGVLGSPGSQLIIMTSSGAIFTKRGQAHSTGRNSRVLIGPAVGGATMFFRAPQGFLSTCYVRGDDRLNVYPALYRSCRDDAGSDRAPRSASAAPLKLMRETARIRHSFP